MPKFRFDVFDGMRILSDQFGDDFGSENDAANQAVSLLPDLARDHVPEQDNLDIAVSVRNDAGEVIHRSISAIRSQYTFLSRQDREQTLRDVTIDDSSGRSAVSA